MICLLGKNSAYFRNKYIKFSSICAGENYLVFEKTVNCNIVAGKNLKIIVKVPL